MLNMDPDAERVMRQMTQSGVDIIFATFGYMESMLKVAKEFPDVKFEHAMDIRLHSICQSILQSSITDIFNVIAGHMSKR